MVIETFGYRNSRLSKRLVIETFSYQNVWLSKQGIWCFCNSTYGYRYTTVIRFSIFDLMYLMPYSKFNTFIYCPTIRLCCLFKARHVIGALIMTNSGPLLELLMRLSYIHQVYGYGKNDIPSGGPNPGPSGLESSALTARPGKHRLIYEFVLNTFAHLL